MTAIEAPYVNLLDPAFYVDPGDAYRWLRDNAPAYWDPVQRIWGISRYQDVVDVEKNGARTLVLRIAACIARLGHVDVNKTIPITRISGAVLRQFTPAPAQR